MFELEKTSLFFESFGRDAPEIVQNIEICHENKISLDTTYHKPKHFILHLNNLFRSVLFLMEYCSKRPEQWLTSAIDQFKRDHDENHEIFKHLRNVSSHQKLVFPRESLVSGLYRIQSNKQYKLKLGFGKHNGPQSYAPDLALRNTEDIFHELNTLNFLMFMDLEHSAISECLGVTRKWFFNVNIKNKTHNIKKMVDVYALSSQFTELLLNCLCSAYAKQKGIKAEKNFDYSLPEFNFVNTLLEIDLYPSLFSQWWEIDEVSPLNCGALAALHEASLHEGSDHFYKGIYTALCSTKNEYADRLKKFGELSIDDTLSDSNFEEFIQFIYANHWHYKNCFGGDFREQPIDAGDIMYIQRLGKMFLEENLKGKKCTAHGTFDKLQTHLRTLYAQI
ncbi:hypothetical protein LMG19089_02492 [Ralstonia edaphis]|uniref:hypothetical protein n=1 Tax=Ralstonia edaphi TaxID=3058599 RepID=UPI0028F51EEE|nr:hypothetical protein [Ralstonia sp. LMG 6871]CAJ0700033.1 hypothetical protein LMG19089_02492 [Ralstonia sp. LMG 6871]